jgi:hypothetical protein
MVNVVVGLVTFLIAYHRTIGRVVVLNSAAYGIGSFIFNTVATINGQGFAPLVTVV